MVQVELKLGALKTGRREGRGRKERGRESEAGEAKRRGKREEGRERLIREGNLYLRVIHLCAVQGKVEGEKLGKKRERWFSHS